MKILIATTIAVFAFASSAFGACASSVSQAKQNGVYDHFLKMSDGKTFLRLKRVSDGISASAGVRGNRFVVLGFTVKVCTNGSNSITASAQGLDGKVTKVGPGLYDVQAPFSYSGRYRAQ